MIVKTLTITAPEAVFDQTVQALAYKSGNVTDDPVQMLEFAKEQLITELGDIAKNHVSFLIRRAATQQAEQAISAAADQITATRDSIQITVGTTDV